MTNPCGEPLVVTAAAYNCGSWSSPCSMRVEVDCPNPRCYWYDREDERKSITHTALARLQQVHNKFARHQAAEAERERVRRAIADLQAESGKRGSQP